ncbi:RNA polymerase subunit sigma-70 (plasmid) [Runella rosea]|uniref:RNA polymerase subunit sigma-70 n=1 Tax=Runella rosea TaxID=2259595 RepID=A0A344TTJ1_9BACT|nr:RNA polymerase sigma factor [Runella rosea]AXE21962.1 RNA polymerase subunit sigma-70 [Runella rosea]
MEKDFLHLLNIHRGILYKVCNLYLDNVEDRQDLFQEIVLQLWKAFPSFRNESAPSTWMYRVALNTAISNFRKRGKEGKKIELTASELQVPDVRYDDEINELAIRLREAIECLNAIEKAIILLYLDERSYTEIAAITGISLSNVGVKINRIKSKLKTIINH